MKDGKVTTDASVTGGFAPEKYTLTFDGARIPSLNMATLAKFANGEEATTPFEKNLSLVYRYPWWKRPRLFRIKRYRFKTDVHRCTNDVNANEQRHLNQNGEGPVLANHLW